VGPELIVIRSVLDIAYRSTEARREHRQAYVDFLESAKYYPDVFQRMIERIQSMLDETDPEIDKVLGQGYF